MTDLVQSIEKVFQGRAFRIPSYQRGYAWRDKQWSDLWEDLELLPQKRIHFTGTLVLKRLDKDPSEFTSDEGRHYLVYDIIDGQQRLTTAILLLKAIYEEMNQLGLYKKLANGLRENYLYNQDEDDHFFTLLSTHPDAQEFFKALLLGKKDTSGPGNRTEKLLLEGKNYFSARLLEKQQELGEEYPGYLKKLYEKVTGQLSLIVYEVENDLDAGVIFETMNDRGRPLTELDKVKNYLLYVCSKIAVGDGARMDLAEKISRTWSRIFAELTQSGLEDDANENQMLRAHWLMAYNYNANNWAQSRTIKETFSLKAYENRHAELLHALDRYVDTLYMCVSPYCDLNHPTRTGAFGDILNSSVRKNIQIASEKFARLGARAGFHPILMAARICAEDNGENYLKVVNLCERFDFRVYEWVHYQPRAAQSILFRLGNEYFKSKNVDALINGMRQTLWDYCPDANFAQRFSNETENWYRWGGIKYFLYEYEQYLAEQAGKTVQMPWDVLVQSRKEDTIEHILPQTPTQEYWTNRFTEEESERWIHDIGNLTLTYDNSPMSNKPFRKRIVDHDDKISYYEDSNLFVERCLKDIPDWTVLAINERREIMKVWATERWKVDPPISRPVVNHDVPSASLTPEERKQSYLQEFIAKAEQLGNGNEFRQMLEAILKLPGHLSLNPTHYGPSLRPLKDKRSWLIYFYPELSADFAFGMFEQHFGISEGEMKELFRASRVTLSHESVPEFISCINRLGEKIQEKQMDTK